ncbi:MAG: hypothetical protein N2Z73_00460 [Endomicrobia bacterium]|nr:hypothetical protein [Endomicrobiia bacterium]
MGLNENDRKESEKRVVGLAEVFGNDKTVALITKFPDDVAKFLVNLIAGFYEGRKL